MSERSERTRRVALLVTALLSVVLVSCSNDNGPKAYDLSLTGRATVAGRQLSTGRHHLEVGQTVTITAGTGVLTLPGDTTVELRSKQRAGAANSVLRVARRPTLIDGDALAVTARRPLRIAAGGATLAVRGTARVRRGSGVTVGVYRGRATVRALGRSVSAPAFRQVAVADTGTLPRRPSPLTYDRSMPDPWDRQLLGDAIDLGAQLDLKSRALTAELAPTAAPDVGYLRQVVPALRSAPGLAKVAVDPQKAVGETLVGASIAIGGSGDFVRRWHSAFSFRGQGADWGLVAADQRAERSSLFGILDGALAVLPGRFGVRAASPEPPVTVAPGRPSSTTTTTTPPPRGVTPPTVSVPPVTVPLLPSSPSSPSSPPTTTPSVTVPPTTVLPATPVTPPAETPLVELPPIVVPPPGGLVGGLLG